MIKVDVYSAYTDFVIYGPDRTPVVVAAYDRSLQTLKGFSASLNYCSGKMVVDDAEQFFLKDEEYQAYFQPINMGKEKFYHMVATHKKLGKNLLLTKKGCEAEDLYNYLMKEFAFPLLKEWKDELYDYCIEHKYIHCSCDYVPGRNSITNSIPFAGSSLALSSVSVVKICMTEAMMKHTIEDLFASGKICITEKPQKSLNFKDMNEYFNEYGYRLVSNLKEQIHPLTELDGEVHDFSLKHLRLYPQQAAQVNGGLALLEQSNYMIMNHGMGTGKTLCGASLIEGFFGRKWLRQNAGKNLKDLYMERDNLKYRNIVMCPGHLVEKWAREIKENIPYTTVSILSDFSQLIKLRENGRARTCREFYVMSKDFGKLSYQKMPSPTRMKAGFLERKICADCGAVITTKENVCASCNSVHVKTEKTEFVRRGMICPDCGRILLPYKDNPKYEDWRDEGEVSYVLQPHSFATHTNSNDKCFYCGENLWVPHVANVGNDRPNTWVRATHYANKAHKNTKSVWVHKKYQNDYFDLIKEEPIRLYSDDNAGTRKYSPALYIKKYLKGYFDFAIFDEAHMYKGGGTGQGHAMHCLVKASKKKLALTGTIAGGYADHLFYLLWRIEPARMVKEGFVFKDKIKFSEMYGKVERIFDMSDDATYNSSTHGKQMGEARVKPGISPLIFTKFLLDRCTFLDLSDMSAMLSPLKEQVIEVRPDSDPNSMEYAMMKEYRQVCKQLTESIKDRSVGGQGLLSTMLQFSLSYPDKPFGVGDILSPMTGDVVISPKSFEDFSTTKHLLSKEKALVELVKSELSEGRNCVIYAEYTASPQTCITYRLKEILEKECNLKGQVAILESTYPKASEREKWMHGKAEKGTRVFITNPKCVETGLDFCWKKDGKEYNYPTLIFYQMGYSMFTISQASRRHYRLNQRKECRTYYMAWMGTIQTEVIRLIAEKQVATSAIQGKFSTEGLAAMASGVDVRLRLAQAMANMDTQTENSLQGMFDVINSSEESGEYEKYRPMVLLSELLGKDVPVEKTLDEMDSEAQIDLLSLMGFEEIQTISSTTPKRQRNKEKSDIQSSVVKERSFDVIDMSQCFLIEPEEYNSRKGKKKVLFGQMSLF